MNEDTAVKQALKSIRESWSSSEGVTWDLVGEVLGAAILLGLFLLVIKSSKNYVKGLKDKE